MSETDKIRFKSDTTSLLGDASITYSIKSFTDKLILIYQLQMCPLIPFKFVTNDFSWFPKKYTYWVRGFALVQNPDYNFPDIASLFLSYGDSLYFGWLVYDLDTKQLSVDWKFLAKLG